MNLNKEKNNYDIDTLTKYVSELVAKESGNILGKNQVSMVTNRLKKRLIDLGDICPSDYYEYLQKNYKAESTHLVSLLTTHHTFFFREFCHFEYLQSNIDEIVKKVKSRGETKIKILSAACSRGQEVYSLAMFFSHHLKNYPGMTYEILGTDIDPESVKIAANGVYQYNEVKSIPRIYLTNNWQRGTGDISRFAKVKANLKDNCKFDVMNLLNPKKVIGAQKFDIIFCRNVFIYFELSDVAKIVKEFKQHLNDHGVFITGLSESLKAIDIEKQTLAPSVYSFDEAQASSENVVPSKTTYISKASPSKIPKPIRILAVDDSPSVLKLLTKIFTSDPDFELVGTANNGLEAKEFLQKNNVDAMTLDIHMPEMDGIEYLKNNFKKGHPHVVMVSSASREDNRYAQSALGYGASDFVEKPALNNLKERANEVKNKIKMSFINSEVSNLKLDKTFAKDFCIKDVKDKARIYVASLSDKDKVISTISSLEGPQPPVFIFMEGNSNMLILAKESFSSLKNVELYEESSSISPGHIYICDLSECFNKIIKEYKSEKISLSIFGILSNSLERLIMDNSVGQILLEDNESINGNVKEIVSDIFPWTSFAHVGTEFLAKE